MRKLLFYLLGLIIVFSPALASASSVDCYCVLYLREVLGVDIHGDASAQVPNTSMREVMPGDIILFRYGNAWHVAIVVRIVGDQFTATKLVVQEANFHACQEDVREVAIDDSHIVGVIRPISTGRAF